MIPGETVCSGSPRVCPDCGVDVLTRLRYDAAAIRTYCDCGAYSRESDYDRFTGARVFAEIKAAFAQRPSEEWVGILRDALDLHGIGR